MRSTWVHQVLLALFLSVWLLIFFFPKIKKFYNRRTHKSCHGILQSTSSKEKSKQLLKDPRGLRSLYQIHPAGGPSSAPERTLLPLPHPRARLMERTQQELSVNSSYSSAILFWNIMGINGPLKKLAFPEESVPRTEGLTWTAGTLHPSERLAQGTQPSLGQSLQTPISFASAMNLEGQTGNQASTYMLLFNLLHASGQLTKSFSLYR